MHQIDEFRGTYAIAFIFWESSMSETRKSTLRPCHQSIQVWRAGAIFPTGWIKHKAVAGFDGVGFIPRSARSRPGADNVVPFHQYHLIIGQRRVGHNSSKAACTLHTKYGTGTKSRFCCRWPRSSSTKAL